VFICIASYVVLRHEDALMEYYLRGEEFLTSLRFKQDASLRGARLLLDQCPHLHAHLVALRQAPPQSLPSSLSARPRSIAPSERLTMEDLFPATEARGRLADFGISRSAAAPQAAPTAPTAAVPKRPPIPSTLALSLAPLAVVGRRCCKRFEGDPSHACFGTIVAHSAPSPSSSETSSPETVRDEAWAVRYDDGDSETWNVEAVRHGLVLYEHLHAQDEQLAPAE
jgi:hypothetical protein